MAAPHHGNLYVRFSGGLPGEGGAPPISEAELIEAFSAFGPITSIRLVAGGQDGLQTSGQAAHAFVRFELPSQAAAAIQSLNGTPINGSQLVVKFADADVQPRVESGRQPSEWCYCRNLPPSYQRQDVAEMFLPFGTVVEIRLFPSTELYKGSGALVQMQSMEQAATAIQTLNGSFPRGATQPLLVRYADSPAEKAAKMARKERLLQKQQAGGPLFGGGNGSPSLLQLQQQLLAGLTLNGGRPASLASLPVGTGSLGGSPELSSEMTTPLSAQLIDAYHQEVAGPGGAVQQAVLQQQAAAALAGSGSFSIYIKGMPEDADKLWLYEKFAKFGGINSVRVLIDEQTGKCNGIGFVNYTSPEAARVAQEAMNGINMGDRLLHVMVQNPAARRGPPPGAAAGSAGMGLPQPRNSLAAAMQPSNGLGLHASTLASLQAGLAPSLPATMPLQHAPQALQALPVGMQGFGMGGQPGTYASLAQW